MSRHAPPQSAARHSYWTPSQAYVLALITLVVGFASGYFFRGSEQTSSQTSISATTQVTATQGADVTVAPMLRQLQQTPSDPALLAKIGNTYYDAKEYPKAIGYYKRSLEIKGDNVDVRTDMATAIWYTGDADGALKEFEQSLRYQPNHGHTLFNIGIVKWQGKNDIQGALASWKRLLELNPNYPERQRVEDLIRQLKLGGM